MENHELSPLGVGTCSKCNRQNQPIRIRWYDANRTQCCYDCYNAIQAEVEKVFSKQ